MAVEKTTFVCHACSDGNYTLRHISRNKLANYLLRTVIGIEFGAKQMAVSCIIIFGSVSVGILLCFSANLPRLSSYYAGVALRSSPEDLGRVNRTWINRVWL